MKDKKLIIQINKPVSNGFAFALNPKNTPKWVDSFVSEETNEWPVKVGSVYKNLNKKGEWHEYIVTALRENEMFEFVSKDGNYHVRYNYKSIDENSFKLEYYEWVDDGELEEPFSMETLEKFRTVLENTK
jgi:hypothetical protein